MNIDNLDLDSIADLSRKELINALELDPRFRDYALPALGMLAAGLLVGAGTALLLAPKSGSKLRADIADEFRTRLDTIEERLRSVMSSDEVAESADEASEDAEISEDAEDAEDAEPEAKAA